MLSAIFFSTVLSIKQFLQRNNKILWKFSTPVVQQISLVRLKHRYQKVPLVLFESGAFLVY